MERCSSIFGRILQIFSKREFFETGRETKAAKGIKGFGVRDHFLAILLLKYLRFRSSFPWSFSNLVAMLRFHLFSYRDLLKWLNKPYEPAPVPIYGPRIPLFQ